MNFMGAEAVIQEVKYSKKKALLKKRVPKKYRPKQLDLMLRKQRTSMEASILKKAKRAGCNVPELFKTDKQKKILVIEKLKGKTLAETNPKKKDFECIGKQAGTLHNNKIIHSDLSLRNIIKIKQKIYIIDFGLGFFSHRKEDFAVELLAFQRAVSHLPEKYFKAFLKGYKQTKTDCKEIVRQMEKIKKRTRYS